MADSDNVFAPPATAASVLKRVRAAYKVGYGCVEDLYEAYRMSLPEMRKLFAAWKGDDKEALDSVFNASSQPHLIFTGCWNELDAAKQNYIIEHTRPSDLFNELDGEQWLSSLDIVTRVGARNFFAAVRGVMESEHLHRVHA